MPPTQTLGPHAKKAQKCVFFIAELSKITGFKNKKLRNSVQSDQPKQDNFQLPEYL